MQSLSEQGYIQQVSIDCVIFGYQNRQLYVLIPKLHFKGDFWALPSGFIYQSEDTDEAAIRILLDRTGIADVYLEQFTIMGKASRDNRAFLDLLIEMNPEKLGEKDSNPKEYEWFTQRTVSIGYFALVDMHQVSPQKNSIDESIDWYPITALPPMIMDHNQLVEKAIDNLRTVISLKPVAFHLLPATFTMKEVQELYETILAKSFAANNFPKRILDLNVLERLEKKFTGAANKAPFLYRLPKQHGRSDQ